MPSHIHQLNLTLWKRYTINHIRPESQLIFNPGLNTALLTGGKRDGNRLKSSVVYPSNCNIPDMESGLYGHVTFLTHDNPPRIATCNGGDPLPNKRCLVLDGGHWQEGLLDYLPDNRLYSAVVRLDAGVFLLGGGYESGDGSLSPYSGYQAGSMCKNGIMTVESPNYPANYDNYMHVTFPLEVC